jgi:hypothetical protein
VDSRLSPDLDSRSLTDGLAGSPGDGNVLNFINVFLNRIFYDIHKSEEVKSLLKNRIYNKLLKIKITQWFKSIELTEINMGSTLPRVSRVSSVHQNSRGLWVELGVEYSGVASATIETCGLNLGEEELGQGSVQLKALLEEVETALPLQQEEGRKVSSRIEAATNSDEEDSAEEDSEDSQELPGDTQAASLAATASQVREGSRCGGVRTASARS